jgi:hypothetical protein
MCAIQLLRHITGLALSRDTYPGTDLPTLRTIIADLHPHAQVERCALMYIGRGDFGPDFRQALGYIRELPAETLARTVTSRVVSLPVYLVAGLAMLAGETVVPQGAAQAT